MGKCKNYKMGRIKELLMQLNQQQLNDLEITYEVIYPEYDDRSL